MLTVVPGRRVVVPTVRVEREPAEPVREPTAVLPRVVEPVTKALVPKIEVPVRVGEKNDRAEVAEVSVVEPVTRRLERLRAVPVAPVKKRLVAVSKFEKKL